MIPAVSSQPGTSLRREKTAGSQPDKANKYGGNSANCPENGIAHSWIFNDRPHLCVHSKVKSERQIQSVPQERSG